MRKTMLDKVKEDLRLEGADPRWDVDPLGYWGEEPMCQEECSLCDPESKGELSLWPYEGTCKLTGCSTRDHCSVAVAAIAKALSGQPSRIHEAAEACAEQWGKCHVRELLEAEAPAPQPTKALTE